METVAQLSLYEMDPTAYTIENLLDFPAEEDTKTTILKYPSSSPTFNLDDIAPTPHPSGSNIQLGQDKSSVLKSYRYQPGPTLDNDGIIKGDKLALKGLMFHGFHGVKPEERTLGQKFLVDVEAWMDLQPAGQSDQLSDTISYTDIYCIVGEVLQGPPRNLLESVAETIASITLSRYLKISAIRVKVGKPHVAVHGPLDYLGVEILRHREPKEFLEKLEWIDDKESFPSVDTYVGISTTPLAARIYKHLSPISVLENNTVTSACDGLATSVTRSRRTSRGKKRVRDNDYSDMPTQEQDCNMPVQEQEWYSKDLVQTKKRQVIKGSSTLGRKCQHCEVQETPQWRTGPMGPKTLCNACGVRYKSGRLVPEYRPANSPTFSSRLHSNSHRKVVEIRKQKMDDVQEFLEEKLERIDDKESLPAVDTFVGISTIPLARIYKHFSPVSVLENNTVTSTSDSFVTSVTRSRRTSSGKKRVPGENSDDRDCPHMPTEEQDPDSNGLVQTKKKMVTSSTPGRKCQHCEVQKTTLWRVGPMGPKTLCNACGVRYRSGRLAPEYCPMKSPKFSSKLHSNSHWKVVEMRKQKMDDVQVIDESVDKRG